ncbi:hypothetical protein [Hyphomicrobium sp.]|uniref:hypothetical protein n=1 Tax=Hyphomicrobium sp. TaxID=82 RepID=UPI0025BADF42|nr:hypothetical protein [Hyphomicrobium sp.]MCC7252174.1 hypothetical protein [Hyphomicrobium sp.]
MTQTARRAFVLALAPLVLMGAPRPSTHAEAHVTQRSTDDVRLELASLKAEARSLIVHIDGP